MSRSRQLRRLCGRTEHRLPLWLYVNDLPVAWQHDNCQQSCLEATSQSGYRLVFVSNGSRTMTVSEGEQRRYDNF
jgi:hypothetical protein